MAAAVGFAKNAMNDSFQSRLGWFSSTIVGLSPFIKKSHNKVIPLIPKDYSMYEEEILQELKSLVGKNASAIAYSNLRFYDAPQIAAVIEAATIIRDTPYYLSGWLFSSISEDGTTEWREPNESRVWIVTPEGAVTINDSQ